MRRRARRGSLAGIPLAVGRLAHSPSDKTEARRTWCPSRFSGVRRGASDAGESPWRQLRERAEEIPGDKKHDPGLLGFSHGVIALRCSIQHRSIEYSTEWIAVFVSSDSLSLVNLRRCITLGPLASTKSVVILALLCCWWMVYGELVARG
jgi:hypothetical protein